jgi:hypothetical protein
LEKLVQAKIDLDKRQAERMEAKKEIDYYYSMERFDL